MICAPCAVRAAEPAAAPAATGPVSVEDFARIDFIDQPALSPDGTNVAGFAGVAGRQIIGVFNLAGSVKPVLLGIPENTQANWIRWVNSQNIIVGLVALVPVEGQRIYVTRAIAFNAQTGKITSLLWDLHGQNGSDVLWTPTDGSSEIIMAAQNSVYMGVDFWRTVYSVNVTNGHHRIVTPGYPGVSDWSADATGRVRACVVYSDDSRTFKLRYRGADNSSEFRIVSSASTKRQETLVKPFLFLPGGDHALVTHDNENGMNAIYETDMLTQQDVRRVFEAPPASEVSGVILSDDATTLLGVKTTGATENIHWIDPELAELQALFDKAVPRSTARIVSFSNDRKKMLVSITSADNPGQYYFYDTDVGTLHRVAYTNSSIGSRRLNPVKIVHYKARDGLDIEAVLTMPKEAAAGKPHPFIVMPHGGPWAADTLSYDYWAQFLATRGYVVLQPNFRGSTGYGTEFLRRGEGQMGLAMQDDVTDGVKWAVKEGMADASRVCIVGASYGGYAAMWGVVKDPDLYKCAISVSGVASLRREVNDFGNYLMGGKFRDDWKRMTPDFDAVSPINFVAKIRAPLLLVHGKKDVTVDVANSSKMYARMQAAGKTVEFVALPAADHYFTRQADRIALLTAMGKFLDKYNPVGAGDVMAAGK